MPYSVPQNIDPNKIFLVNFSELEGRWDPTFTIYNKNINHYAFPIVRLQDLIAKNPQYGTAESGIPRISELAPRYIRITDIDELGNLDDGLGATAENIEMQYILNENDILFARSGATVGKAYLHRKQPYVCFFAGYMIRFVVDNTKILPQYLFTYTQLKPYKDWVKAIQRAAAQPNINAEEYKSLPTSLPPLHIQQQIVDVYNAALSLRKKKLSVSKAKLASIDKYLLDELGITLPQKDNSLEKRIFTVNFSKVGGRRLDPKCYSTESQLINDAISKGTYECRMLKGFLVHSIAGDWGYDENEEKTNSEKCLVIRSTEFDNEYNLKLDNSRAKYRNILKNKLDNINLQVGDLLIEKSGGSEEQPVGRVVIITDEILSLGNICYSNFIHKISVTDILPEYLYCYLKTAHNIKLTDSMQSQTNGLRNLILKEYFNQLIPLPPLEKQREIANNIAAIRAEAKRLEQEGEEILQSARLQVEQMIFGKKDIEG